MERRIGQEETMNIPFVSHPSVNFQRKLKVVFTRIPFVSCCQTKRLPTHLHMFTSGPDLLLHFLVLGAGMVGNAAFVAQHCVKNGPNFSKY